MKNYLKRLVEEKGHDLDDEINLDGHIGLTYRMLFDYIHEAKTYHKEIKRTLVYIDFKNGDVFHYLDFLAKGMVEALGLNYPLGRAMTAMEEAA
jgi:hypothetical protein